MNVFSKLLKHVFISFLFLMSFLQSAQASHGVAMDLTYTCVDPATNQYLLRLVFYRDCGGISAPSSVTLTASNNICGATPSVTATQVSSQEVSQLCGTVSSQCGSGTLPGVEEYVYEALVTMPAGCPALTYSYDFCCRTGAITNIPSASSEGTYIETVINTSNPLWNNPCNDSPQFTNIPVLYTCAGQNAVYTPGAIDPDGDSLVFSLSNPIDDNGTALGYSAPFTTNEPMCVNAGNFSIDPNSGQVTFTPCTGQQQYAVFGMQIEEYRNGVLIGTYMREITVVVQNCTNSVSSIDTLNPTSGTITIQGQSVEACKGETITFDVLITDPDSSDVLTITSNIGLAPIGGSFITSGTNPVTATFTVNTTNLLPGNYPFTITVNDGACPVPSVQTLGYVLTVSGFGYSQQVYCANDPNPQPVIFGATGGTFQIVSGGPGLALNTTTGIIDLATSTAGTYEVLYVTGVGPCPANDSVSVTIVDIPDPSFSYPQSVYCVGNNNPFPIIAGTPGGTFSSDTNVTFVDIYTGEIDLANTTVGSHTIYYEIVTGTCNAIDSFVIDLTNLTSFTANSSTFFICPNEIDTINLSATPTYSGATPPSPTYNWTDPANLDDGTIANPTAIILLPEMFVVTYDDGLCPIQTDTIDITAPYPAQLLPTADATICSGASVQIGAEAFIPNNGGAVYTNNTSTPITAPVIPAVRDTTFSTLNVSGVVPSLLTPTTLLGMQACMNINLQMIADLQIYLIDPCGNSLELSTGNGGFTPALNNVCFSPTAVTPITANPVNIAGNSTYLPEGNFNVFNGCNANGDWTLMIIHTTTTSLGGSNGTLVDWTLSFNDPATPSYEWSPNYNISCIQCDSPLVSPTVDTTYTVYLENLFGCRDTAQVQVFLDSTLPAPIVTCGQATNSSVTFNWNLLQGIGGYQVSIDGGTPFVLGDSVNTYTVTGLAEGQCVDIDIFALGGAGCPDGPITNLTCCALSCGGIAAGAITPSGSTTICIGESLDLTANTGQTYQWSTTETTETISVNGSGLYTVTVTDFTGCLDTASIQVNVVAPPAPTIIASGPTTLCNGQSVQLDAGAGFASYDWAPVGNTQSINATFDLMYYVTVTDANGCSGIDSIDVTIATPVVASTVMTPVSCNGDGDGTATASATGGYGGYTYSWNDPSSQANATATALDGGIYTVTATDLNGCSATSTITVTEPTALVLFSSSTAATCSGTPDGTISLNINGGQPNYTILWDDPAAQTTTTAVGLTAGIYNVSVTDASGCFATLQDTVTQPTTLTGSASITSNYNGQAISCFGVCDGEATAVAAGGTPPYSYLWADGQTTAIATGLCADTIDVIIADSIGCSVLATVTITEPSLVDANINASTDVSCNAGSDATATSSPTGGTAPYTFLWDDVLGQTTSTATGLSAGDYIVTVTDANGCTGQDTVTIVEPTLVTVNAAVTSNYNGAEISCNAGSDGELTATASGGVGGFTYLWDDASAQTTNIATGISVGGYCVTATDANGCTASTCVTITEPSAVTATLVSNDVSCNGGSDADATLTGTGGTGTYTYLWDDGQTTVTATGLAANASFCGTVSDVNNCIDIACATITEPAAIAFSVSVTSTYNGEDVSCNGACDGEATLTTTGGTAPYTFLWDDPAAQTTAIATGLCAGIYNATVTDANACTNVVSVTLTEPSAVTATITATTDASCNTGSDGTATANGTGGTAPYTYSWTDGQTTATAVGLAAGTHDVTVTDANGCFAVTTATVTEPSAVSVTAVVSSNYNGAEISCNGFADGELTASASGGSAGYTYLWDDGQTTAIANGVAAGTYCVTATDANGCAASACVTITEPTAVSVSTTVIDVSCNGGSDGEATATASGGTGSYSYLWDDALGQSTANATALAANTYNVVATDQNGCTATTTATVGEPATAVSASATSTAALCFGSADGTATVTAAGGAGGYTYLWDDASAQSNATATSLLAGTYNVTVTDQNGCSATASVSVADGIAINLTTSNTAVSCNGGSDGTATVAATGGTGTYTYQWSASAGAQTTATAANVPAGTHGITVTDGNGCAVDTTVTVTEPTALNNLFFNSTTISCNGLTDGTATANVSGGTPGYSYSWDNGQTTQTATGFASGPHNVTITDANGCTISGTVTITEPSALTLTTTTDSVNCVGGSDGSAQAFGTGGTAPYSFSWSTGTNFFEVTNLPAGVYTVTMTDANACQTNTSVTIGEPTSALVANILSANDPTCFGDNDGSISADALGGTPNYTFSWSNGANTQSITGLSAGTYTVTATDANGCSTTASASLSTPTQLVVNAQQYSNFNGAAISCPGAADGAAEVTASGGVPAYTYAWSGAVPQNTTIANNLAAGTYIVTVTDATGCAVTDSIVLNDPVPLQATETHVDVFCNGDCDGQILVNAVSGTGTLGINGYEYNITGPGQTGNVFSATNSFFGLCAGTYTVTVRDGNNCTLPVSITIAEPAALAATTANTDVSCNGGIDGSATVTATGGVAPYTYNWSNGQTTQTAVNLAAGGYDVTITDDNGCDLVTSVVLAEPTAMAGTTTFDEPSCNGGTDGSATVTVTGGTAPYTYLWNTGSTNATAIGLGAGSYTVTSTDANGCQLINTVTVSQPQAIAVTISGSGLTCSGNGSGSATANPTGGTAPYTYLWSDGQTTATATGLNASTYTVLVVDANGCSINAQTTLSQPTPVVATQVSSTDVSCNGGADGSATVMGSGGSAPYTYNWDNGQTGATATGLAAGTYTATITDANGCDATISVNIFEPAVLEIPQITTTNVSCKGGSDGSASAFVNGGTFPYSFSWSNGETTQVINNLAAGTYFVTVTDGNGCTANSSVIITEPAAFLVGVINVNDALCDGTASGQLAAVISGGTLPASGDYTYVWSNGASTPVVSAVTAGTYSLTVIDANGCTLDLSATVGNGGSINANIVASADASCFGGNDGSATVTATGGTGGLTYQWSDPAGQTNPTATNLAAGTYYVTVNDANGCAVVDSVTVGEADAFSINTNVTDVACFGENSGQLSITGASVTPGQILWSNGQVGNAASNLSAGAYSVTVTSIDGCTQTFNYNITQPTALELSIDQTSPILCNDDSTGALAATVNGGTANYSYSWTDGVNGPNRSNLPAGTYTLQVTDANGCTVAEVSQLGNPTAIGFSFVDAMGVACVGDNNGFIQVQGTGGSTALGNYEYSLDGQNWQSGNLFPNLTDGQYDIYVRDLNGCTAEDSVEVAAADSFLITAFNTTLDSTGVVEYGDSINLEITLNEPTGAVVSWIELNNGTTLDSALAILVNPTEASIYRFTAVSPAGCVVDTSLTVQVDKPRRASAPTAFTPNSDGTNDAFFIQAEAERVSQVQSFRVYDRWGELVFESINTQPNDPQAGWDGTFKGKTLQSAVFAWYAEVEFIDGHVEVLRGEVTLLR
jgi:gliding motility-associated-like protein